MNPQETDPRAPAPLVLPPWPPEAVPRVRYRVPSLSPSRRSLFLAGLLALLTLITSLIAGVHFAAAYRQNQAASLDEFFATFARAYHHPGILLSGVPFALTLLGVLLVHELGHFFACRRHHIHSSYPFFLPAPTLIGTFGAFLLIRSPIRSRRALFDVGASGPLVGFLAALPALAYGVLYAKVIPSFDADGSAEIVFGVPLILRLVAAVLQPNAHVTDLLLHPVGRAAWVGLFATALNLIPVGQLDGGHIVRSLSQATHRYISLLLPVTLLPLGYYFWNGWFVWAGILFFVQFFRMAPLYDPAPLDPDRRLGAVIALAIFVLCFMPSPLRFN